MYTLACSLPKNCEYLLPYLENASIDDIQACTCPVGQGQVKVKHKHHVDYMNRAHEVKLESQTVHVRGHLTISLILLSFLIAITVIYLEPMPHYFLERLVPLVWTSGALGFLLGWLVHVVTHAITNSTHSCLTSVPNQDPVEPSNHVAADHLMKVLRTPGFTEIKPEKEYRRLMVTCSEMH